MARSHTKIKSKDNILDYILLVIFIGVIIVTLYPFLNVLAISFNDPIDTMRNINFIIPRKFASVYKGIHIKTTKNGLPTY